MNNDRNKNHFFKGAFLLTYASLLSKVLSALYRIPLQNLAGDVGFYTYQQIYPFLGMAMILALYGFPAAVSRFIASQKGGLSNQLKRKVLGHLDRKSTRLNSSHVAISYAVFCLKKKINNI